MATKTKTMKAQTPRQMAEARAAELELLKETVGNSHGKWIGRHPKFTLGDLLAFLRGVEEEFLTFDADDILADMGNELGDAADYLNEFEDFNKPIDSDGALPTVGYRAANVEEDIEQVEELIELVGESFKVKKLLPRTKAAKN